MPEATDLERLSIVIPLNKESQQDNIELRYALRSIEYYLPHSNVVIVGDLPNWTRNVIHIPAEDEKGKKQLNIRNKILRAIESDLVTDNFMVSNDDIFLLKPFESLPNYCMGDLEAVNERGAIYLRKELMKMKLPTTHFDVHYPIIYNKSDFRAALFFFSHECIIKSAYANYWKLRGEEIFDLKINIPMRKDNIYSLIKDRICFSIGDAGLTHYMREVLNELYPLQSHYEH